jgi:hypothetical protein
VLLYSVILSTPHRPLLYMSDIFVPDTETEQKNTISPFLPRMSQKATKGIALIQEMDCDQTMINLLPVTSAVFVIANSFG